MRLIGFDLGSSTGYAWTDDGKITAEHSGVQNFTLRHYEGGGLRILRAEKFFAELICVDDDVRVYFEAVVWRTQKHGQSKGDLGAGPVIYGELSGALMRVCEVAGVPFEGFSVGEIKKHSTGKGNSNKEIMTAEAQKQFGLATSDDNQADALHVLSLGLHHYSSEA